MSSPSYCYRASRSKSDHAKDIGKAMMILGTATSPLAAIPGAGIIIGIAAGSVAGAGALMVGTIKLCKMCKSQLRKWRDRFHEEFCDDEYCKRCSF